MRRYFAIASLGVLTACSSSVTKPYFETAGVSRPNNNFCAASPQSFGKAEKIKDFSEGNGCGVSNGYRIFAVSGVNFSEPATVTCSVANTFNSWVENSVQPQAENIYGERVVAVKVAASYACRPRNNVRGAKLSEHGMGNAIDIAAFTLASGKEVTVLGDYYSGGKDGKFLKAVRGEACGPFHTVLGPGSDAAHKDHLHMDLQRMRSGGAYCH
jgi:hypothetical protein